MKKLLVMCAMTLFVGIASKAQIGESASKKIETTVVKVEETPNKNYDRITFGWAPTTISLDGESTTLHGFGFGWTGGYNVTKGKRLPLYIETGIGMNVDFGEFMTESDFLMNFEVPVNVTYRYNFKNTKIYVAPYFGFHFKVNALLMDDDANSYFDYEGTNRFQFGMQLGVNFDLGKFHVGFGWDKDFMPIWDLEGTDYSFGTSGARINIGITF